MKYFFVLLCLFSSCANKVDKRVYISSNDADSLVIGLNQIDEKDKELIPLVVKNLYDNRLSMSLKYNGQSVYQARMNALKKISGRTPPRPITREPDSLIANFYSDWARSEGYLP